MHILIDLTLFYCICPSDNEPVKNLEEINLQIASYQK